MNLTGQTVRQRQPREKDKPYTDSFANTPACEACGAPNDGTIVGAHLRDYWWGQDKPHDYWTMGLCMNCHDILDRRKPGNRDWVIVMVLKKLLLDRYRIWKDGK